MGSVLLLVPSSSLTQTSGYGVLPYSSCPFSCPFYPAAVAAPLKPSPYSRRPSPFLPLALKSPKGFGPPPPSPPPKKSPLPTSPPPPPDRLQSLDDDEDDEVPELVTNRMLKRMAFTVGIPLGVGVLFFPFFYYLKVGLNVDVPEWLPFLVSGLLFGTSAFGITYGILSTSWDPLREGSVLGIKEAKANWPLFFQRGKQGNK